MSVQPQHGHDEPFTRRVVTGHTDDGRAAVVSDGPIPRRAALSVLPEMSTALVWATSRTPVAGPADPTAQVTSLVPGEGETRLLVITVPPQRRLQEIDMSTPEIAAERQKMSPGLAECFERDHPGMHRTPTVDYGFVLSGEVAMELDNGQLTHLRTGDIIIQNATRHAWRNMTDAPSTLAFVLIGARDGAQLEEDQR